jgi:hypothetical protein
VLTALAIHDVPSGSSGPRGTTDVGQAIAAEALGGRYDLAGLVHAADAAAGRLAARRRSRAA